MKSILCAKKLFVYNHSIANCTVILCNQHIAKIDHVPYVHVFMLCVHMCVCMYIHVLTVAVADPVGDDDDVACLIGSHNFRGKTVNITRGDYSDLMKRLVDNLQLAKVRIALYAGVVMRPAL